MEDQTTSDANISRFITLQTKEISIKEKELELKKANEQNGFEYSKLTLEAQERDLKHSREFHLKSAKYLYAFCAVVVVGLFSFLAYSIYAGKSEIAKDIINAIIYVAVGGIGGYSYGKSKS